VEHDMPRILIVDDDVELCELLSDYLTQEGFEITCVHDGEQAANRVRSETFDLMVLDVMLPKKNGFEVLREVSYLQKTPVLMLTAKGDEVDRILGLEMGADDYLSKPCNPRELTARIRSIIRRAQALPPKLMTDIQGKDYLLQDLKLVTSRREVFVGTQSIELTATEFHILQLLVEHAGTLVTREQISEQCLGRRLAAFDRSIDMHISHLRRKLGLSIDGQERIKTIRGVGYQYVAV
jgi:two-component system response regulator CpxR